MADHSGTTSFVNGMAFLGTNPENASNFCIARRSKKNRSDCPGQISQNVWSAARLQGEVVRGGSTVCVNVAGVSSEIVLLNMMMIRACRSL